MYLFSAIIEVPGNERSSAASHPPGIPSFWGTHASLGVVYVRCANMAAPTGRCELGADILLLQDVPEVGSSAPAHSRSTSASVDSSGGQSSSRKHDAVQAVGQSEENQVSVQFLSLEFVVAFVVITVVVLFRPGCQMDLVPSGPVRLLPEGRGGGQRCRGGYI